MSQKTRIIISISSIMLLACVLYYLFLPIPYTLSQGSIEIQKTLSQDEWKEYRPENGKFTALLPSIPQHAYEEVLIPNTQESISYDMHLSQNTDGNSCLIHIIQYPCSFDTSNSDILLEGILEEMAAGNRSTQIISKTKSQFLQNPSMDFHLSTSNGELYARVFIAKKAIYVLSVLDSNSMRGMETFTRFVESFSLLSK
ncbi:MAG: hypothetical protein QRY74_05735 [Chlamydia sp.]